MTRHRLLYALRRIFGAPSEPVEGLLAITLLFRGILAIDGWNMTAQAIEPSWTFIGYILLAFVHLWAMVTDRLPTRRVCAGCHFLIWSGITIQFAYIHREVATAFPVLALFSVWAFLRLVTEMQIRRGKGGRSGPA